MGFSGCPHWVLTVYTLILTGVVLVYGVDLFPPPQQWVPPNCIFEVDNITQPWTWQNNWDLIHISPSYRCLLGLPSLEHADIYAGYMLGSFSNKEWENLYSEAYKNCAPGGWIEQIEVNIA